MKQSQTEGDRVADLQREPRQRSADKAVLPFANPSPVPKEMKQALLELEGMSARHEYLIQLPDPIESQVAPPPAPPTMSHEEMPPLRYSEDYDEHIVNTTDAGEFETVKTYLREIAHIPMITHEREIELAQRIEAGDRFILANLRLVVSIARRYIGHGLPLPDL